MSDINNDINDVVEATWVRDYVVRLRFEDGTAGEVDLREYPSRVTIFRPLADVSHFRRFTVVGGTLSWPNGADIAPERLHELMLRCRTIGTH